MSAPPHLPGSYLVVELTNRCSLACVHCSVSQGKAHPHHATSGYLDPGLALGLFDDLVAVRAHFDALVLFWLGEPLLHPHFGLIWRHALRAAVNHGTFGKVELHTNATHLSADRIRLALNDADVEQPWHFSLDAIDRQTYREIKGMDRFDRVQENVAAFLRHKAQTGARWPRPVFQFIVGSNNVAEVGRFREHWEGACRRLGLPVRSVAGHVPPGQDAVVFFRQLDCPTADQQRAQNEVFVNEMRCQGLPLPDQPAAAAAKQGRSVRPQLPTACSGFWKSPVIGWQGDVTTCTRDNLLRNRIGTLQDQRFSALWWGRAMAERRASVSRGCYDGLPLCQTCFIPQSLNYSHLSSAEIAIQAAWDADHVRPQARLQAAR
ncbi:MAG: radical SAM/SPASM domain-containing protein [Oligoflexia bacterium]|nr:radical SAM/SPASM domain-containing protein [Oligoflexia bacterium]